MKRSVVTIIIILLAYNGIVQAQAGTYILNGSATQTSCNCYTLTEAVNTQSGSVWNATQINLQQPFNYTFNIYLGCNDASGADGMVFILQRVSSSVGATGGGLGFGGVTPSVGIELDTWQNTENNDPAFDHISINRDGSVIHGSDLAGPVQITAGSPNAEDCSWHLMRIEWNPATQTLSSWFDGELRVQAVVDLVGDVFSGDPLVYWGFSGATGGSVNEQKFCTTLEAGYEANFSSGNACVNEPVQFSNESISFGPIISYVWDFGDGTGSSQATPPPHVYTAPGAYDVKLVVTGFDGCKDSITNTVHVGAYPVADITVADTCRYFAPRVTDNSTSDYGEIVQWNWTLDGVTYNGKNPALPDDLTPGPYQLQLTVETEYGCASTTAQDNFLILIAPVISAEADDGCVEEIISFDGVQLNNAAFISEWKWNIEGADYSGQQQQLTFTNPGTIDYTLQAIGDNGCASLLEDGVVTVSQAVANAGRDTTALMLVPHQLNGSGGVQYEWQPPIGLNDPFTSSPMATLSDDQEYVLYVTSVEGCTDTDTVFISVFKGSAIYVPTAFTPNGDGLNDLLKPTYIGITELKYFRIYNRWGQQVFSTNSLLEGWDGRINGAAQQNSSFAWMLEAVDFVGHVYRLRGTFTLVR